MNTVLLSKNNPHQPMDASHFSSEFTQEERPKQTAIYYEQFIWYPNGDSTMGLSLPFDFPNGSATSNVTDIQQFGSPSMFFGKTLEQGPAIPLPPPVVLRKSPYEIQARFVVLQKWEGMVLEVQQDSFFARLVDQTQKGPDEEAEFPMEEIPVGDRVLVVPGAVFYWNIGYSDSLSGQRTRASVIRFRRLPVWQSEEFTRAKQEAQQLRETLGWK